VICFCFYSFYIFRVKLKRRKRRRKVGDGVVCSFLIHICVFLLLIDSSDDEKEDESDERNGEKDENGEPVIAVPLGPSNGWNSV